MHTMSSTPKHPWLSLLAGLILLLKAGASNNGCTRWCGRLPIQFPFQLKGSNPDHGGYPGFVLSCTSNYEAVMELAAAKFYVRDINYQTQEIHLYDLQNCLPNQLLKLANSSISPFLFKSSNTYNVALFDCSSTLPCPVWPVLSSSAAVEPELLSCTKVSDVLSVSWAPRDIFWDKFVTLEWSNPNCSMCEAEGKKCRLKVTGIQDETECYTCKNNGMPTPIIAAGVTGGSVLLVLIVIALFYLNCRSNMNREDQVRVEKFLEDYRALKPTRFSYFEIKRITNGFKYKLGEGAHGAVFKGSLSQKIQVAVKILNDAEGDGKEFINEMATMEKIHHINVVRLLGFCADGYHRALIYGFFPNGSLQKYISLPDKKENLLGWERMQEIALGIAKEIEYLHNGCDHRILHFDINPHNVLLDDNFIPKISDFGLAKLCSKNQSTVSVTAARGTLGYIAPEVFSRNFGNVSYKSDIYSYGMLLLELVGGRKNIDMSVEETFNVLYPEWVHNLLEGGDMHIQIEDEEDNKIVKKLAVVGLWCIQWHPVDHPSMKTVVQMLEGEGDKLIVPPSPFDSHSTASINRSSIISVRHQNLELEIMHEERD